MRFLLNFFLIFITTVSAILATKLLFLFYYFELFNSFSFIELASALVFGLWFDFAVGAAVALLATLIDNSKRFMALSASMLISIVLLLQLGDILYFGESSRHISYEIVDVFGDAKGLVMTAFGQHTAFIIIALIASVRLWFVLYSMFNSTLKEVDVDKFVALRKLALLALALFFIRGMFVSIPLNPWYASKIGDDRLATLSLCGSYSALYSLVNINKQISSKWSLDGDIDLELLSKMYDQNSSYNYTPHKRNVVLIFLESWSAVHMKPYGYIHDTTPFFNSIIKNSLRPKVAVAGGHRTTEGMFCALTSAQNPLARSVAKTSLQNFKYRSLVHILNENGYESAFFQGTAKETSGTGSFAQSLGFKQSFGKEDITTTRYKENSWGVQDPDLYEFVLQKTQKLKEPFIIGINNATTHDDIVPDSIKKIEFDSDDKLNKKLNTLHFSDSSLKDFVAKVQEQYSDTLFVFVADHCGGGINGALQNYLIPLAFYGEGIEPKLVDSIVSQRSVAPTLIDLTLGDYRIIAPHFSASSLIRESKFRADYYHNGTHGWIRDGYGVEFMTQQDALSCYDLKDLHYNKIECNNSLLSYKDEYTAFTDLSQQLLFKGETTKFREKLRALN